jgi:hypothetical protein
MTHGARHHAKYSGSGAHRWMQCAGQVAFTAELPPVPDTPEQIEGELAHEYLEAYLLRRPMRPGIEPEMLNAIDVAADYIESIHIHRPGLIELVEHDLVFPQSSVPASEAGGIADLILIDEDAKEAWVIDFKYGHTVVEPGAQGLFYATAAFWRRPMKRINIVVIQPRVEWHPQGPIRTKTVTMLDLVEFKLAIEAAIRRAEEVETSGRAGDFLTPGSWCRFCAAEATCPARQQLALTTTYGTPTQPGEMETRTLAPPEMLGLDRIVHVLNHADTIREWLKAVERFAYQRLMNRQPVPGYKLVEAGARRRWNGEPEDIAAKLWALTGYAVPFDAVMPRELIDITKAEALLMALAREAAVPGAKKDAAGMAREKMAFLTVKNTSGNLLLAPEYDKRPAVDRTAAVFANVRIPPMEG